MFFEAPGQNLSGKQSIQKPLPLFKFLYSIISSININPTPKKMQGPSRYPQDESANLQKLSQDIKTVKTRLTSFKNIKQCNFVLGATGSGKSTFISYMAGAEFTINKKGLKYVLSHNNNSKYPEIGNTSQSCTQVPNFYPFLNHIFFYDPPGFVDTKGPYQRILNSYSNAKMFQIGTIARIILVVELSTLLSARGGAFVDITDRLYDLFLNDFDKVANCCLLVISKVNTKEYQQSAILEQIDGIAQQNKNLKEKPYYLLKTLVKYKRVVFFPTPDNFQSSLKSSLQKSILNTNSFHVAHQPNIPIEPDCKHILGNLNQMVQDDMIRLANEIGQNFRKEFCKDLGNKTAMKKGLAELKLAQNIVVNLEENKQIKTGVPDRLDQLQQKLKIHEGNIKQLRQYMSQVEFCLTLYPQLRTSHRVSEILLNYIEKTKTQLEMALNKITSEEERQQMIQQHQKARQEEQAKFKEELQKKKKEYKKKVEKAKKESERAEKSNNKMMERMMNNLQEMQQNHRSQIQEMKEMNQNLIEAIKEKKEEEKQTEPEPEPEPEAEKKEDDSWCTVM